jgi:hypothetical protein
MLTKAFLPSLSWTRWDQFQVKESRSQWPRDLRHEPSSSARTLGSWVRIPLEAWMPVCLYSVFVLPCEQVQALRWPHPPSKKSYRLFIWLKTWKGRHGRRGCRAIEREREREREKEKLRKYKTAKSCRPYLSVLPTYCSFLGEPIR